MSELEDNDLKLKNLEMILNLNSNKEINSYFKKYVDLKNKLVERSTEAINKMNRYDYLNSEKDKEIILLKESEKDLQNEISNKKAINFKLGLLSLFILLVGFVFFVLQRRKIKEITLRFSEKDKISKELNEDFSKRLFKIRENLSSLHNCVDEKELNKYSFHLRELESVEKEIIRSLDRK